MAQEITKHPGGRPSVWEDPAILQKLIDVFRLGATDTTAIAYAKISSSTFYTHYKEDEEFSQKIDEAKQYAIIAARQVVVKSIVEDKDLDTAKWYLEKHDVKQQSPQQNTQVNVFTMLKDKYTKKNGIVHTQDVVVEETHD